MTNSMPAITAIWITLDFNQSLTLTGHGITFKMRIIQGISCLFLKAVLVVIHSPDIIGEWTRTPGHMVVLANTTARFHWEFNNRGSVNIAWYYKGTEQYPALEYILGFSRNETYIPINGNLHNRLGYDQFLGSAVMTLENVTNEDRGFYEAKVVDLSEENLGHYISDISQLEVIEGNIMELQLEIEEQLFKITFIENGTHVRLPSCKLHVPARLYVRVGTPVSALAPSYISMSIRYGSRTDRESSCNQIRVCERKVPLFERYSSHKDVELIVIVKFPVYNLEPFMITRLIEPELIEGLDVNVHFNNESFQLSSIRFGSDVSLTDREDVVPAQMDIAVAITVIERNAKPTIEIFTKTEKEQSLQATCHNNTCNRRVTLFHADGVQNDTDIIITISDTERHRHVHISKHVHLETVARRVTVHPPSKREKVLLTINIIMFICNIAFVAAWFIIYRMKGRY